MGERGPKPKFTDVACPNESCRSHLVIGQGNIVGNGTYQVGNKRIRRYLCRNCDRAFCDRTNTFYYNLRTDKDTIELARAAEQCETVNEAKMKNLNLPKIEMDELWVIIQKK